MSEPTDHESLDQEDHDETLVHSAEETSQELCELGGSDLEAAYLKAMMALEASDEEMPVESPAPNSFAREQKGVVDSNPSLPKISIELPISPRDNDGKTVEDPQISAVAEFGQCPPKVRSADAVDAPEPLPELRPTPRQIIEACLFVGGSALTSKKLSTVLRGDFDSEFVDREIDELNRLYAAECRPYEIRLGDGGYRLTLREEFERIRHKVYGLGPKEVRLSQEALEVLAVVAYHQPIKQSRVEELGKPTCGAVLRQLVRRELLAVERDPAHPRDVHYKTTTRFLSLFGIRNLDELPRHEQVSYK